VRELENRIKQAVLLIQGPQVTPADLDLDSSYSQYLTPGKGLREAREAFEKDLIQRAPAKHGGNISRTASELGVSRPTAARPDHQTCPRALEWGCHSG
jgi:two-component system NtrC family response regulator